jgi:hypothetical protein
MPTTATTVTGNIWISLSNRTRRGRDLLKRLVCFGGDNELILDVLPPTSEIPTGAFTELELQDLLQVLGKQILVLQTQVELVDPIDLSKVTFSP